MDLRTESTRPYPPGWLDRLTDRVRRLPGPSWLYFLGLLIVQLAYVNLVLWLNGKALIGSLDTGRVLFVFIAPYLLWVRGLLDRVADRAFDAFRPTLQVDEGELSRLRYEITSLSARDTRIVTAIAAVVSLWSLVHLPTSMVALYASSLETAIAELGIVALFTLVIVFVSSYQVVHQLRMVVRVHALAARVDVFRSKPLYAFSGLAAGTGMSLLVLAYVFIALRPEVAFATTIGRTLLAVVVPTAIACFVLPLRGMHLRIKAEKDRLLAEANARFAMLIGRLHQRVDDVDLADADKIENQFRSLALERDVLGKISTWPWEPATLTGFITTLVVPALLMLMPRLLERLGF